MEITGKFSFKIEFEKILAVGVGFDTKGIVIILPFMVIMIGFKKYERGIKKL